MWIRFWMQIYMANPACAHAKYNVADGPSRAFDPGRKRETWASSGILGRHVTAHSYEQGSTPSTPLVSAVSLQPGHKHCLEPFAGAGGLSAALQRKGLRILTALDLHHGPHHDLSRVSTQQLIIQLVSMSLIWFLHLGTPCTVWSRARHAIKNVARARGRELLGVQLAAFSVYTGKSLMVPALEVSSHCRAPQRSSLLSSRF